MGNDAITTTGARRIDLSVPDGAPLPAWALPAIPTVDRHALVDLVATLFRATGVRPVDAALCADALVLADARGHPSHGVSRLRQYLRLIDSGSVDPRARHVVVARRSAFETWDARRGMGHAVAHRAMSRAIARARHTGIAAVVVRDGGHFGIAGAYVLRAMEAGMIGLVVGNASPGMTPTGACVAGLGTNPIAIGAPDGEGRGFLLDMATSVVAQGKVEIAQRRGRTIPDGWAIDRDGRPTTDPAAALQGTMLPLGGDATTAGYKGYGLAAAVDVLTGLLGGGAFALAVTGMWDTAVPTTGSQLHLAIDPSATGSDLRAFQARLRAWRTQITTLRRQPGVDEILLAGDPEWRADARQAERIELLPSVLEDLARLAFDGHLSRVWRRVVA